MPSFVARVCRCRAPRSVFQVRRLRPFVRAAGRSVPVPTGAGCRGRRSFGAAGLARRPSLDEAEVLAVEDVVAPAEDRRPLGRPARADRAGWAPSRCAGTARAARCRRAARRCSRRSSIIGVRSMPRPRPLVGALRRAGFRQVSRRSRSVPISAMGMTVPMRLSAAWSRGRRRSVPRTPACPRAAICRVDGERDRRGGLSSRSHSRSCGMRRVEERSVPRLQAEGRVDEHRAERGGGAVQVHEHGVGGDGLAFLELRPCCSRAARCQIGREVGVIDAVVHGHVEEVELGQVHRRVAARAPARPAAPVQANPGPARRARFA